MSTETLDQIRDYLTSALTTKVGTVLNVATEPGPQVLRMQAAITGVQIKTEGMKVYEVLPVAAVFGSLKAVTGNRAREVFVFVEVKFSDSETGEVVGAIVRRIEGKKLKGMKDQLELEDMKENMDSASDDAQAVVGEMFSE